MFCMSDQGFTNALRLRVSSRIECCETCGQPKKGNSIRKLASDIGVNHSSLWRFLTGKLPSATMVDKLIAWLEGEETNKDVNTSWDNCDHEWIASGDFELGDVSGRGSRQEVVCEKCRCPGEMYDDGTVDWPTT